MASSAKVISIKTSSKNYCVQIAEGLLSKVGELAASTKRSGKAIVVSDSNVSPLYSATVIESLSASGFEAKPFVIEAGERSKNIDVLFQILKAMASFRMTRKDTLFALGGGVVGDIGGLAASLYMRGIGLIQLPTSLLAAVDSSVGGKTAIDLDEGKNLVGSFYQPDMVLYDTKTLSTLPPEQIANGFGEIIKTGMIRDERLFNAACDAQTPISELVARCVEIKADVVAEDEKESGPRMILNFGHTFGHSIEKCSSFALPHGYCVALGMSIITAACVARGSCGASVLERLQSALKLRSLPTNTDFNADELFEAMMADKKRVSNSVTLVLPRAVGSVELRKVSLDEARAYLIDGLAALRARAVE